MSDHDTAGNEMPGKPWGTSPTTLTPCACRSMNVLAMVAAATAMRGAGHRGLMRWTLTSSARVAAATMSVVRWVSLTTVRKVCTCSTMLSPWTLVPVTLPSCPTTMRTAPPAR